MAGTSLLQSLIDPRGRCNRKGLLVAAVILLGIEAVAGAGIWLSGIGLDHPVSVAIKAVLIWAAVAAAAQRLHDIGHSAWGMLWAAIGLIAWAFALAIAAATTFAAEEMQVGGTGFAAVFGGLVLPMLATMLWMHFAPGEARANRFGPVPEGLGFSRHESRGRPVPSDAIGAA